MNLTLLMLLLLGTFIALNVPIAVALGASAIVVGYMIQGNVNFVATVLFSSLQKVELLAIPFFILAGNVLDRCGIMERLFLFVDSLVGQVRGSTSIVASAMSVVVSGLSGSGPADTAALGSTMGQVMEDRKYPRSFTAALISSGAGLAIVVPPSVAFILYGIAVPGVSIGEMFVAGILPGILMGALLAVVSFWLARRRGYDRVGEPFSLRRAMSTFGAAVWGLLAPIVIVGGIYIGAVTPTEAAGVAVIYGLLVGIIVYRSIGFTDIVEIARSTAIDTAAVMMIVATASLFAWVMAIDGTVVQLVRDMSADMDGQWQVFLVATIILLIAGCFIDGASIYLVIVPLLIPAVVAQGIDLVWFGIFVALTVGIGQFTPPVGVNLFVASRVLGIRMDDAVREILPFLYVSLVGLLLIYLFPAISTWLPSTMR
ncbi:MAG TPA: TRAP transporter large permease [Rhizobiaceae bacterium]|nr:TRAP transporter large permease [Rhizobiaceae bacterium]